MELANEKHLQVLARQYWAKLSKEQIYEDHFSYFTRLCDTDAADFIHDLPSPIFIESIVNQSTNTILYKNPYRFKGFRNTLPQMNVDKQVFWNARQMERFMVKN